MNETASLPVDPGTSRRAPIFWFVVLALGLALVPILLFLALATYFYASSRSAHERALVARMEAEAMAMKHAQMRAEQALRAEKQAAVAPPSLTTAVNLPVKWRPFVVELEVRYDGFPAHLGLGLVVERDGQDVVIVAPAQLLRPVSGKVNGRLVSQNPQEILVRGSHPGTAMAGAVGSGGMPLGMSSDAVARPMGSGLSGFPGDAPNVGAQVTYHFRFTELQGSEDSTTGLLTGLFACRLRAELLPLRFLGDIPTAQEGDELTWLAAIGSGTAAPEMPPSDPVRVLPKAGNERPELGGSLVVSPSSAPLGSLLFDSQQRPVGMLVAREESSDSSPAASRGYVAPLSAVFEVAHTLSPSVSSTTESPRSSPSSGPQPAPTETQQDDEARRLAQRVRDASPEDRPARETELRQLLERQFDQRQSDRQRELEELEQRLARLSDEQARRQQQREAVVRQRLMELLGSPAP
ncbi:MAG: hypothetical protein U0935_10330 [Pirellulales bacterium]